MIRRRPKKAKKRIVDASTIIDFTVFFFVLRKFVKLKMPRLFYFYSQLLISCKNFVKWIIAYFVLHFCSAKIPWIQKLPRLFYFYCSEKISWNELLPKLFYIFILQKFREIKSSHNLPLDSIINLLFTNFFRILFKVNTYAIFTITYWHHS